MNSPGKEQCDGRVDLTEASIHLTSKKDSMLKKPTNTLRTIEINI